MISRGKRRRMSSHDDTCIKLIHGISNNSFIHHSNTMLYAFTPNQTPIVYRKVPTAPIWIHYEMLILAAGLTDIISRMPSPPEKMKKTNHYVQWQQLKQLHKATYVGSYKPLVSRVGLCVSAGLWTFLTEPLFGRDFNAKHKTQPTQTDAARWKGMTQWAACEQETGLRDRALVWGRVWLCIFLKFAFLLGVRAARVHV